jgi:aminopeptidase
VGRALIEEAYEAGGEPYFHLHDYELEGALLAGASESQMRRTAAYELARMREMDCYIDIRAMDNVNVWNCVPAEGMAAYRKEYWGPLHLDERCNHTRWVVTRYPNDSMAQLAGMSTDEYEDFYFRAMPAGL